MAALRGLPWFAKVYLALVIGAAFALLGHSVVVSGRLERLDWSTLLVLALLFLVCESVPTLLNVRQAAVSVSFSAVLAAVVLVGPEGAALVGMTAVFSVRPGLPLVKRLFNSAQFAICGYVAGWVYQRLLGGRLVTPTIAGFDDLIVPFAGAAAVFVPLNFILIALVLVATGQADQVPLRGLAQFLVSYLGYATFGLLIAGLWATVNSIAAVLVLLPLFVARWAFGQYLAQQRSYDATIAALCQAVETKDYYTRGHCTRVSLASGMIAQEIGMGPERLRAIRYAGMLHDVGSSACRPRCCRRTARSPRRSTPRSSSTRCAGWRSCGASTSWTRRSPGSCTTTNGRTARATRWGWPETRSRSSPGSSRWPTPSTR